MKCSNALDTDHYCGNIKVKMVNQLKSPYRKNPKFDNIVDQLCDRLQDIKDQESSTEVGMHLEPIDQTEAVRRYYAAFPALKKGEESPRLYYLPPPAWCKKPSPVNKVKMQNELALSKESIKNRKLSLGKERRNSYHSQRKGKKRCHNFSRLLESKENLPEWVTHEGVWDMETQDPIKEFIRAIAVDEGYGTCENTVTDEIREIAEVNFRMNESKVPDWDDSLDLDTEWVITEDLNPRVKTPMEEELYAKFEAKFDRSIEALWSRDQANTPDDEYQELPIDFQDLLSSPSDNQFTANPSAEKTSMISLTESIWSNDGFGIASNTVESPTSVEVLHDRFKPLNLADDVFIAEPKSPVQEVEPFSLYSYEGIYDAVPSVADVMRSLTALNHSKKSSFTEVIPRRPNERKPLADVQAEKRPKTRTEIAEVDGEDPLVSTRTHFRPIHKEAATVDPNVVRYADGDTFDIECEFEPVEYTRSDSGFMYIESEMESPKRYLEYRTRSIDYSRLNLTDAQRRANDLEVEDKEFRLKFPVKLMEKGCQTDDDPEGPVKAVWACEECGRQGGAKKMRQSGIDSIWSDEDGDVCGHCSVPIQAPTLPAPDEREWEELLSDISAAHAQYATEASEAIVVAEASADRKRRHSAALRCGPHAACSHPHAPFLHCIGSDRPLTR